GRAVRRSRPDGQGPAGADQQRLQQPAAPAAQGELRQAPTTLSWERLRPRYPGCRRHRIATEAAPAGPVLFDVRRLCLKPRAAIPISFRIRAVGPAAWRYVP